MNQGTQNLHRVYFLIYQDSQPVFVQMIFSAYLRNKSLLKKILYTHSRQVLSMLKTEVQL